MRRRGLRGPLATWAPVGDTPGDPTRLPYAFPVDGWGAVPDCPGGSRRRAQIPQEGDRDADPAEE